MHVDYMDNILHPKCDKVYHDLRAHHRVIRIKNKFLLLCGGHYVNVRRED